MCRVWVHTEYNTLEARRKKASQTRSKNVPTEAEADAVLKEFEGKYPYVYQPTFHKNQESDGTWTVTVNFYSAD